MSSKMQYYMVLSKVNNKINGHLIYHIAFIFTFSVVSILFNDCKKQIILEDFHCPCHPIYFIYDFRYFLFKNTNRARRIWITTIIYRDIMYHRSCYYRLYTCIIYYYKKRQTKSLNHQTALFVETFLQMMNKTLSESQNRLS